MLDFFHRPSINLSFLMLTAKQKQVLDATTKLPMTLYQLYSQPNQSNLQAQSQSMSPISRVKKSPFAQSSSISVYIMKKKYKSSIKNIDIQLICQVLQVYLGKRVKIEPQIFTLNRTSKQVRLPDGSAFEVNINSKGLESVKFLKSFKLSKFYNPSTITVILAESNLRQGNSQIDGRALGNSHIAVISLYQDQPHFTITTLVHQVLHLVGMGHCKIWNCLMNPITSDAVILCPACLQRLDRRLGCEMGRAKAVNLRKVLERAGTYFQKAVAKLRLIEHCYN